MKLSVRSTYFVYYYSDCFNSTLDKIYTSSAFFMN